MEIDSYQKEFEEVVESNEYEILNSTEGTKEIESVYLEYPHTNTEYISISNEVDFKLEFEDTVKIENDSCQEEFMELGQKQSSESDDNIRAVSSDCSQVVSGKKFIMEIEPNVKIEIDSYQEESKDVLQGQFEESDERQIEHNNEVAQEVESAYLRYSPIDTESEAQVDYKLDFEEIVKNEIDSYQEEGTNTKEELSVETDENIETRVIDRTMGTKRLAADHSEKKRKREKNAFSTTSSYIMRRKQKEHRQVAMFVCTICQKGNKDEIQFKRHMVSHLKEAENTRELQSVDICDKLGIRSRIIAEIKGEEYDLEIFKCMNCEYIGSRSDVFKIHIRRAHFDQIEFKSNLRSIRLKERKFECHICEYKSNQKTSLNRHLSSVHFKERNFKCHLCNYKANQKTHLDIHLSSVHLKERKFECHLCEYKATQKSCLNRHLSSVHSKERKFECHFCEYTAKQKSTLDIHFSSVHLNERKFECHLCHYKANRKSILNVHLSSVHLKERKFECHLCDYRANQKSILNAHLSSAHLKERKFRCRVCHFKTNQKTNLNNHLLAAHLSSVNLNVIYANIKLTENRASLDI